MNRLEALRHKVNRLIDENCPDEIFYFVSHLYGVSRFCVLLARKRGLDAELAATCGMLHDIYQVTDGTIHEHAVKGAVVAQGILKSTGQYSDEEISIITTAISTHSKKRKIHEPYGELLKDADVLDHCFYNPGYPVLEKEMVRYNRLCKEFNLNQFEESSL